MLLSCLNCVSFFSVVQFKKEHNFFLLCQRLLISNPFYRMSAFPFKIPFGKAEKKSSLNLLSAVAEQAQVFLVWTNSCWNANIDVQCISISEGRMIIAQSALESLKEWGNSPHMTWDVKSELTTLPCRSNCIRDLFPFHRVKAFLVRIGDLVGFRSRGFLIMSSLWSF